MSLDIDVCFKGVFYCEPFTTNLFPIKSEPKTLRETKMLAKNPSLRIFVIRSQYSAFILKAFLFPPQKKISILFHIYVRLWQSSAWMFCIVIILYCRHNLQHSSLLLNVFTDERFLFNISDCIVI